jgi:hypothetical protein
MSGIENAKMDKPLSLTCFAHVLCLLSIVKDICCLKPTTLVQEEEEEEVVDKDDKEDKDESVNYWDKIPVNVELVNNRTTLRLPNLSSVEISDCSTYPDTTREARSLSKGICFSETFIVCALAIRVFQGSSFSLIFPCIVD